MLTLDKPRAFNLKSIRVPLYHRGHLSLLPQTKVWLCLLPGGVHSDHPEMVIAPIDFLAWADVWRINITTEERVGVVNRLFQVLERAELNVLAAETSSIERQRYHTCEVIVDAREYADKSDGDSATRQSKPSAQLKDLERSILAEMLPFVLCEGGRPKIKVRRLKGLYDAVKAKHEAILRAQIGEASVKPVVDFSEIDAVDDSLGLDEGESAKEYSPSGQLLLPENIRRALSNMFRETDGGADYLLASDTRDRFLRAYLVSRALPLITATIRHVEKPGAIEKITRSLSHRNLNIVTSLCRLQRHGELADFEVAIQPTAEERTRADLKKSVVDALGAEGLQELKLSISFSRSYSRRKTFKPIAGSSALFPSPISSDLTTLSRLSDHYTDLTRRLHSGVGGDAQDAERRIVARLLLDEEQQIRQRFESRERVFVSYHMEDQKVFADIASLAEEEGIEVVGSLPPSPSPRLRDNILSRMDEAESFLAIWTPPGGERTDDGIWPSPWLHWELGAAASRRKKIAILSHESMNRRSWQQIYGDIEVITFSDGSFSEKARVVLRQLSRTRQRNVLGDIR